MATHPVAEGAAKDEIRRRVRNVLTQRTIVLNASQFLPEEMEFRYLRTIAMVCAAYAANVLENALATLGHEARERAFAQVDELLAEYSQWPFVKRQSGQQGVGANLSQEVSNEINSNKDKELQLEVDYIFGPYKIRQANHATGCRGVPERFHKTGFAAISNGLQAVQSLLQFQAAMDSSTRCTRLCAPGTSPCSLR